MMDKSTRKFLVIIFCLVIIAVFFMVYVFKDLNSSTNTASNAVLNDDSSETVTPVEESTNLSVEYSNEEIAGNYSNYTAKIDLDGMKVSSGNSGISISNTTIKIVSAGVYYFSGTAPEGNIVIEADKNADVVLVFDNVSMTCSATAVINGIKANTITISSVSGSTNTFTDSDSYTVFTDDDEPNGTIFSKTDVVINGSGKLVVNANYEDGIVSKDILKIVNSNIEVNSADDGIRGKDFTAIKDSKITIKADGDGIKSTNTDSNLGYVIIDGSDINIEAGQDGIQGESVLNISDSKINVKTIGDTSVKDEDGEIISSKGLKAGVEVTINSGDFNITATDDTIHSNSYVIINGGTFELSSGDDGIHADNNILITDGDINITKSYEGIEAEYIKINGGNISVAASDDGINVCGGNDGSGFGEPGKMMDSSLDGGRLLIINGGNIKVYAEGDGLDANGSIQINGGYTIVAGSKNGGNGALDYDSKCTISGGTLIYYGASGMWQDPTTDSIQYVIAFSAKASVGDKVELKDSSSNTIVSFTAEMAFGMIGISSNELENGEIYTLYINGEASENQEITSIITSNGSLGEDIMDAARNNNGNGRRGMGGQ